MKYDIIIIGAGAAGLAAAYRAIRQQKDLNILVLEKENIPGRKINASGNGKCNLTNNEWNEMCYHSEQSDFVMHWVKKHSYNEIVQFFENMGVLMYEKNGYFYPVSNQAKQVSNILYEKSQNAGIQFIYKTRVKNVQRIINSKQAYYQVSAMNDKNEICNYEATCVILATGGAAAPKLGGCRDGYHIAEKLGMHCTASYPVLCPIYVEDEHLHHAKGVRLDGMVTLKLSDGTVIKESGQIQFNDNNLSGIVMMNASCYVNRMHKIIHQMSIHIDVLPQYSWDGLRTFFIQQQLNCPDESLNMMLSGILPEPFIKYIIKRIRLDGKMRLSSVTDKQWNRLTSALKKLDYSPLYVEDYDRAQVTGGGVSVDEVDWNSFESRKYHNLYLTGELLDLNGKCGGYNLTFAILSGIQAADDIVKHLGGNV